MTWIIRIIWGERLVDFRKNIYMYTVYPGSAYR